MHDIFIAYASEDRDRAEQIATLLKKHGWSVWWDPMIPAGKSYARVIKKALDSSRCVVVLWSSASVESDWVMNEAQEGKRREILIPILIEEVSLPFGFDLLQTLRLLNWSGTVPGPEYERFLSSISDILEQQNQIDSKLAVEDTKTSPELSPVVNLIREEHESSKRLRKLWGIIGALLVFGVSLIIIKFLVHSNSTPPSLSPSKSNPEPGHSINMAVSDSLSKTEEPIHSELFRSYKIDIYYDANSEKDRRIALLIRSYIASKIPDSCIVQVPRTQAFFDKVGAPSSYEVRYDSPSEKKPAEFLAEMLQAIDPQFKAIAATLLNQTPNILSIFVFSNISVDSTEH